jgi:hypothetical protein
MAIEVWDGGNWQDIDDPEICTSAAGYGTFTNIQRGEIWTGSGWETFFIRSAGGGGTAAAPVIALSDKSSRRIRVTVSHTNTSGDNVIVLVYVDDTSPPSILFPINTQRHPDTGYTTTTYSGQIETFGSNTYNSILNEGTTYYIGSAAWFYNSSGTLIKSVSGNTLTVATHPYYTSGKPVSLASYLGVALKTTTQLYMYSSGNAYNNGDTWLRWQYQSRNAGTLDAWTDLGTVDDSSNLFTDNESDDNRGRSFTALDNAKEYRFRSRVVYSGLGNSNSEVGPWGSYSNNIRPIYLRDVLSTVASMNNATYFNAIGTSYGNSLINADSEADTAFSAAKASDGSNDTVWSSSAVYTTTDTKTITSAKRDGTYVYYYADSNLSLSTVSSVVISNIERLRAVFINRNTYNLSGTRYTDLSTISSSIYPFDTNDQIVVTGSSGSGINGTYDPWSRKNNYTIQFRTPLGALTSGTISDGGNLTSSTSGGSSIANLNQGGKSLTASKDGAGGVKVATGDVGSTREFSLTTVLGTSTPTMVITGTAVKSVGDETLNAYFSVKDDYLSPKMTTSDYVSVTNGDQKRYIKVYLNNTLLANVEFEAGETKTFNPDSTQTAFGEPFVKRAFYVKLEVARVNTAFGWLSQIKEVKIRFRYSEYYDDGIT